MLDALKALSAFFNENSLRTRRNLRSDIERRSLSINQDFLETFKVVKDVRKLHIILIALLKNFANIHNTV